MEENLGNILSLGNASAGLIGVYFCIRTFKLIIDTLIHGYALHTIYGWSIHLIGAFWDSVTNLLLHLANGGKKKEENQETSRTELKEIKEEGNLTTNTIITQTQSTFTFENEINKNQSINCNETQRLYPQL